MAIGITPAHNHLDLGLTDDAVLRDVPPDALPDASTTGCWPSIARAGFRSWSDPRDTRQSRWHRVCPRPRARLGPSLLPRHGRRPRLGNPALEVFLRRLRPQDRPDCQGAASCPTIGRTPPPGSSRQSSAIGTQYPHAVGIAQALKLDGRPGVVVVYGGEGSTSEGDWHEAMNFAGVHQLPVVFIIENNRYAISVPRARRHRRVDLPGGPRVTG